VTSASLYQHTLANHVSCAGVGLHSGSQVHMTLRPAPAGMGVVFKRMDVAAEQSLIPARFDAVCETRLGTVIRNEHGVTLSTVEHLMAALWGAGVDNVIVEVDGPEVPIMDGSSEPFMFMVECAGLARLAAPKRVVRVLKTVEVREGESIARISPHNAGDEGMFMHIEIAFNHPAIGKQTAQYDFRDTSFKQSLSRARTFGFEHEVAALRSMGLARGGSLENAIVLGKDTILNEEGLRYADEFVRHKALDCVGDLFLAGAVLDGVLDFVRPGHAINNRLLRALFSDSSAYQLVDAIPAVEPAFIQAPVARSAYA
jgi:UDP-3-O-[3-hydroxymyristoyl] N-acetylglucosamine deacetylase